MPGRSLVPHNFSKLCQDQSSYHTGYQQVPNARYGLLCFFLYPKDYCRTSVAWIILPLRVKLYFKTFKINGNRAVLLSSETQLFCPSFFKRAVIQRQIEILLWNQSQRELRILRHISTKSSKHGPVAFSEMEIQGFEVFGRFQLIFAH